MTGPMHVAIDYDGTYTAAPEAWSAAVAVLRDAGVRVSMVTARDDRYDRTAELDMIAEAGTPVHFTRGFAKRQWMAHIAEDPVDVWIDDRPESVIANSDRTVEDLAIWRNGRQRGSR
ncbi:MAG: hypothetical protein ABS76_21495 [Pelagibacterium sp. SCN 64-44]|jgi:hypothetical protein|nr:MAG: hypothetical protein ABS76_21495 [Pelagibacterium sp. SCN 64-44]